MQSSRYWLVIGLWLCGLVGRGQTTGTLPLPFFDDFATANSTTGPSPLHWEPGSNVYINNTMATGQPSLNIASFDGLRANGTAYSLAENGPVGTTDVLTSRPVNLAGLTTIDNVFISFYWLRRGLGDAPDTGDSLALDFATADQRWVTVWSKTLPVRPVAPTDATSPDYPTRLATYQANLRIYQQDSLAYFSPRFTQQLVRIANPQLLHASARFRFRTVGRQTGLFDMWHVDYVYMNKNRSEVATTYPDITTRRPVSSLLRRYTAMPLRQFLAKPNAELAPRITTDVNNLDAKPNLITYRYRLTDQQTGRVLEDSLNDSPTGISPFSSTATSGTAISSLILSQQPNLVATGLAGKATLVSTFRIITTLVAADTIPGVNGTLNNVISGTTVLDNYYAYDDGSAEVAAEVNQPLAQVAMRFVNNVPDAVKGVRINIPPTLVNQAGQPVVFSIYDDTGGNVPGSRPILQQSFPLRYDSLRNGFAEYLFTAPVNVRDTFYVAFSYQSAPAIPVGLDLNSPFRNNTFLRVSGGTTWSPLADAGVRMIRPVMNDSRVVVTANEPNVPANGAAVVYPNPSTGGITWAGTLAGATRLDVTDLTGRIWLTVPLQPAQTTTDLGMLPDGFYLLRFTDAQERQKVVKFVIRH